MRGRLLLWCVSLMLPAAAGHAMDLNDMLTRAVEHDARVQSLSGVLANTLIGIEKSKLAPGFQLRLSTGDAKFGYSFNPASGDPPWIVSAEPSGALLLGRKTETEVSVEVPFYVAFGEGYALEGAAAPKISVRQPLDRLFGAEKLTDVQRRQNLYAAEKARVDLLTRACQVEQEVLAALSSLARLELAAARLRSNLIGAQDALEQAVTLKSYAPDSAQQRQLELAADRLQKELELNGLQQARARQGLERLVGQTLDALPAALPEAALTLPDADEAERNPAVYLAKLAVELEQARLEEERDPAKPKWYLGGALRNYRNELIDDRETTLGAAVEGVFEDISVSAGVGGIVETGTVFLSAGLSWNLRDRKIEALDLKTRENTVEVSRWNLSAAREAYLEARELLGLEVEEMEARGISLREDRALADLKLAEATRWLEQGLVAPGELDRLRRERETLDLTERVLQLEALQLASRLAALTANAGDKQ